MLKDIERSFVMLGADFGIAFPATQTLVGLDALDPRMLRDVREQIGEPLRNLRRWRTLHPRTRFAKGPHELDRIGLLQLCRRGGERAEAHRADRLTDRGDDMGDAFVLELLRIGRLLVEVIGLASPK